MKTLARVLALSTICFCIFSNIGSAAAAADVFVRKAKGVDLNQKQLKHVTNLVKGAVHQMPEHHLVRAEGQADFVLEPSIIHRGRSRILRVEKRKDGTLLATSEQQLSSFNETSREAKVQTLAAAEGAMMGDTIAANDGNERNDGNENLSGAARSVADSEHDRDMEPSIPGLRTENPRRTETTTRRVPVRDTVSGTTRSANETGGDVRAPSPIFGRSDANGAIQVGVGPGFGSGMNSEQTLFDVNIAYAMPYNPTVSTKAFGDLNFANGSDANRFINLGLGADVFPMSRETLVGGRPYIMADAGYAFTRNREEIEENGLAAGAGLGYKFSTAQTETSKVNMDLTMHYTQLTAKIRTDYPSVFGVRLAVNF